MPYIFDPERGLKIGLTDNDYDDYQTGNLSDDFYARRADGSIANKVEISRLEDVYKRQVLVHDFHLRSGAVAS